MQRTKQEDKMNATVLNMTLQFIVNGPLPMTEIAKAESIKTRKKYNTTALRADSMSIRHLGLSIVRTAHGPRLMRKRFDTLEEQMQEARRAGYVPGMMPTLWDIHHNTKRIRMTQQEERDAGEGEGYGAVAESMARSFEDIDAKDFEPAYNSMPGGEPALDDDHTRLTDDELLEHATREAQAWMQGQKERNRLGSYAALMEQAADLAGLDTTRWANRSSSQSADDLAQRVNNAEATGFAYKSKAYEAVSVMRPTIYGNPHKMEDRKQAVALYEATAHFTLAQLLPLVGKKLKCACPDRDCHAVPLARMVNSARAAIIATLEQAWQATTTQCAETDCSPQTSREPAPEQCAWRLRLELANKGMVARQEAPALDFEGDYDYEFEEE